MAVTLKIYFFPSLQNEKKNIIISHWTLLTWTFQTSSEPQTASLLNVIWNDPKVAHPVHIPNSQCEQTQIFEEDPNPKQPAWAFVNVELPRIKTNYFRDPRTGYCSFTHWALQHTRELLYACMHSFIYSSGTNWKTSRPLSQWDLYLGVMTDNKYVNK